MEKHVYEQVRVAGVTGALAVWLAWPVQAQMRELPAGALDPEQRATWPAAAAGSAPAGGVAMDNANLLVAAKVGADSATVYQILDGRAVLRARLDLPGGQVIRKVTAKRTDDDGVVAGIAMGEAEFDLALEPGACHVKVSPGPGASALDVGTGARFALLPDFFADDTLFDPARVKAAELNVPAENFILHLCEDRGGMVICVWPGTGTASGTNAAGAAPAAVQAKDPDVELHFAGEGSARRIETTRIEFAGRPIYVGILGQPGAWHHENVSNWKPYMFTAVNWKRPFEARWRAVFALAEGQTMKDWPNRIQSFDFRPIPTAEQLKSGKDMPECWWSTKHGASSDVPIVWMDHIKDNIQYPTTFRGDETRVSLYVEKSARQPKGGAKPGALPNLYETMVIYPLDRTKETPLNAFTPIDLVRATLGVGPCEYALDIAGVKGRPGGADREVIAPSVCDILDTHLIPLISRKINPAKQADGTYKPLDPETKKTLLRCIEDEWFFVHAVHDRIREYRKWGEAMQDYLKDRTAKPKIGPLANDVSERVALMLKDIGRYRFEGPDTEAYWKDRLAQILEQAKQDQYAGVLEVPKIRNLGNREEQLVSRCRQCVKGLRQDMILQDTSDSEVKDFVIGIHNRCREILRNRHPAESI